MNPFPDKKTDSGKGSLYALFAVRNLPENRVDSEFGICQHHSWQSGIQPKKSYVMQFWQTLLNPV